MNPIQRKADNVEMNSNDHRGVKGGLRRLRRLRLLTYTAPCSASPAVIPVAFRRNGPKLAEPSGLQTFQRTR